MEETFETNFDEGDSHAWLGDGVDEEEEPEQNFDYLEDEEEALALNFLERNVGPGRGRRSSST